MSDTQHHTLIAGRYSVIKPLGRGGVGKVFLAEDRETGARVALKLLRSRYQGNAKANARFHREIDAVRRLDHPGIVRIFDAGRDGDMLFYTMEYIEGKTLRQWMVQRGKLPLGSVVRVLCLLCDALEHAHRVTIHRDISPENVMVMRDGSIRLLDFGMAKKRDAAQALTQVGVSLGKILYVAPEQRMSAAEVDHRADLYPLGVMLYETLAGDLPDGRRALTEIRPDLPPAIDQFLDQAMADSPGDRFQSAREFRKALLRLYKRFEEGEFPTAETAQSNGAPRGLLARLLAWFRPAKPLP